MNQPTSIPAADAGELAWQRAMQESGVGETLRASPGFLDVMKQAFLVGFESGRLAALARIEQRLESGRRPG